MSRDSGTLPQNFSLTCGVTSHMSRHSEDIVLVCHIYLNDIIRRNVRARHDGTQSIERK